MKKVRTRVGIDDVPSNGATEWKMLGYDKLDNATYYERIICTDDGIFVSQFASEQGKPSGKPTKKIREYEADQTSIMNVRQMTEDEKKITISRRGRGLDITPHTIIVNLHYGFSSSFESDVDGGLGVIDAY